MRALSDGCKWGAIRRWKLVESVCYEAGCWSGNNILAEINRARKSLLRTENPDRLYIVVLPSRKYLTYIHAGAIAAGTDDLLQKIVNVRPCLVRIIADRPALIELLWQTYPI